MDTNILLSEYLAVKKGLDHYKKTEAELRIQLLERCFGKDAPIGTSNTTIGNFVIKGVFTNNYKLDEEEFDDRKDDMSDAELMCVKLKPMLVMGNYNKLESTPILDECITVSPAMPSIAIKEISDD
jgi:hypothetical protein